MGICPKCGSEKIHQDTRDFLGFLGGGPNYVCEECGYKGKLVLEVDSELQEDAKETLEDKDLPEFQEQPDFSKTKFVIGAIFLLMGIPLLIYSPLGGNFLVGALSAFIGILILHQEYKKRNI